MNLKFFTTALLATGATAGDKSWRQVLEDQKNAAKLTADLHYRKALEDQKNLVKNVYKKIADLDRLSGLEFRKAVEHQQNLIQKIKDRQNMAAKKWDEAEFVRRLERKTKKFSPT